MYVACPSCKALYAISAEQLRLADGRVRCSQCRMTFNAAHAVFADPREALAFKYPLEDQLAREIDELVGRALDQVPGAAESSTQADLVDRAAEQSTHTDHLAVEPVGLPSAMDCYAQPVAAEFVSTEDTHEQLYELSQALLFDDEPMRQGRTGWGAIAAVLLLTAALVGQYAWWDRSRLAQVDSLRPALEWLCKPVDCNLPLRHDLARVEMVEREVRDHPRVRDALLVSAAFVNRAQYPQAYPVLQISFSDVSGTPVAVRRFMPEEYLHDKNPAHGMAAGEQTLVMLEVVDPGERAVSFQFDFM
jgi:predicted Zn finger-like uncharacterized protein